MWYRQKLHPLCAQFFILQQGGWTMALMVKITTIHCQFLLQDKRQKIPFGPSPLHEISNAGTVRIKLKKRTLCF